LQVSKQASAVYGVCEVWKQELPTLIVIISGSASSWFSTNYTIDKPGRFLFGKFQEEAIAFSCLLLAPPVIVRRQIIATDVAEISNIIVCVRR